MVLALKGARGAGPHFEETVVVGKVAHAEWAAPTVAVPKRD